MGVLNRCAGVAAPLLLFVSTGCFTTRPLEAPVPAPATRIVATVTDSGTVAMSNSIGPGAVEIEGVVASADHTAWQLNLIRVEHRDGRSLPWNRELVTFPRYALDRPLERRLDKRRSWLTAGAITVTALLVARLLDFVGGDDATPGEPIPQELLIPGGGR